MELKKELFMKEFREVIERTDELKGLLPEEYHELVEQEKKGILENKIWAYLEG